MSLLPALLLTAQAVPELPPAVPAPTVAGHRERTRGDPLEGFNRDMFSVHQAVDKAVLRPAAMGYRTVVPKPVRAGLRHFFSNLGEPIVFLNDLLQLRPGRALRTFGRFTINSTLGVGGLIDVAKGEGLPHRANGFGGTFAYYGVKPGPYIFVPLIGPTTLRDLIGGQGDNALLPVAVGTPFDTWQYQVTQGVTVGLDTRAEVDAELRALFQGAVDPYATLRSVYLQNRASEIATLKARGRGIAAPDDIQLDDLDDPGAQPAAPEPEKKP